MQDTKFRPLYQQVRDALVARIAGGHWAPGERIPSEFALAEELKVSQGTVRKALNALSEEHIVIRRQGRGTFVPEQTAERTLSHFFHLRNPDGTPAIPTLVRQTLSRQPATAALRADFNHPGLSDLWLVERIRTITPGTPILERILIRTDLITDLDKADPLPASLYQYYQSAHGITINRVEDRLRAVSARRFHIRRIDVAAGTPLIVADRISFDLRGGIIETRATYFPTGELSYAVSLN
jgi:GntR family transcriptional regulator